MEDSAIVRRLSAAVFGNEKLVEVVAFVSDQVTPVTSQMVASGTAINYSLVRDALTRLVAAGVVTALPKAGGSRSAQFYQVVDGDVWRSIEALARTILAEVTPQSMAFID